MNFMIAFAFGYCIGDLLCKIVYAFGFDIGRLIGRFFKTRHFGGKTPK